MIVRAGEFGVKLAMGLEAAPWAGLKLVAMFSIRQGGREEPSAARYRAPCAISTASASSPIS